MNTFVLIVMYSILYHGVDSAPQQSVEMQEFNTYATCESAGKWLESNAKPVIVAGLKKPIHWKCVPK